ncbi:MAG: protein phosphatase CheZ [Gammaproteobacteria bacterium]|nr:protein phosphatase CheZ [Gammaproteobacteria bacterium]
MNSNQRLELARALVEQLEAGKEEDANQTVAQLAGQNEGGLYQEVGRLTRELHDTLNSFLSDGNIADLAEREMPDARERLRYVISMTEKSADTTLTAIEQGLPLTDQIGSSSQELGDKWKRFTSRQMKVVEFRELSRELGAFLPESVNATKELHKKLSDVLMAQEFQDLTGQIIRQVITLVTDVEDKLVELVRITGAKLPEREKEQEKLEGPVIPGVDQGDTVNGQDDVDDLLSSLGF